MHGIVSRILFYVQTIQLGPMGILGAPSGVGDMPCSILFSDKTRPLSSKSSIQSRQNSYPNPQSSILNPLFLRQNSTSILKPQSRNPTKLLPQSSILNPQSSTKLLPQSSTSILKPDKTFLYPQSSILNPRQNFFLESESSILNPQSSIREPQSSILNCSQSSILNLPQSSILNPVVLSKYQEKLV
jgi:hypothetical protein